MPCVSLVGRAIGRTSGIPQGCWLPKKRGRAVVRGRQPSPSHLGVDGEQARPVKTVKGSMDPAECGDFGFRPSASPWVNLGDPEARTRRMPVMGDFDQWSPNRVDNADKASRAWWLNVQSGPCKPRESNRSNQAWGEHGLRTKANHEKWRAPKPEGGAQENGFKSHLYVDPMPSVLARQG